MQRKNECQKQKKKSIETRERISVKNTQEEINNAREHNSSGPEPNNININTTETENTTIIQWIQELIGIEHMRKVLLPI